MVYDERDRRFVPLLVAVLAALLAAAVVGGLSYELARAQEPVAAGRGETSPSLRGVTDPQAASGDDAGCSAAVQRADEALALAGKMDRALSDQTSVMGELLAGRATSDQVLDRSLPTLTAGAKDRQAFRDIVREYEEARAGCGL